ncbi:MAG: glutamate--tRNA ligase [Bdellovibrionota bacterium]
MNAENQNRKIRCRFAPSPTGYLHLGGARTALFNYLFARRVGGTFVLRIEDTDLERSTNEAVDAIFAGLDWLRIHADEGPFFQSQRTDLYRSYAQRLLQLGAAYRCYATAQELDAMREAQRARNEKPKYDGRFRPKNVEPQPTDLPVKDIERPFVIRFRAPQDGRTVFEDLVLGSVSTPNEELEDMIIIRSDGSPTYNFTVVVDDIEMQISHVIRGSDHVSNTPKQVAIYNALGAPLPAFVHVPMILGEDKKKLSKRHGATSVIEYKKDGYLTDAFVNYLVRLGWSHGDQEIFTRAQLESVFDLENIGKSAAVFDFQKLRWVNSEHIKLAPMEELLDSSSEFFAELGFDLAAHRNEPRFQLLIHNLRERSTTLRELAQNSAWYFLPDTAVPIPPESKAKFFTPDLRAPLEKLTEALESLDDFTAAAVEAAFKGVLEGLGMKLGKVGQPIRLILTGTPASPPLFALFEILGKDRSLARLKSAPLS